VRTPAIPAEFNGFASAAARKLNPGSKPRQDGIVKRLQPTEPSETGNVQTVPPEPGVRFGRVFTNP